MDEIRNDAFSSIEGYFHRVGYDLSVTWDGNTPYLKLTTNDPLMPAIEVDTQEYEGRDGYNVFGFLVHMQFPTVHCPSSELEFYDSVEYITEKWVDLAREVSSLLEFEYDPVAYEDDEM